MSDDNNQQREVPEAERVYSEDELKAAFRYAYLSGLFDSNDYRRFENVGMFTEIEVSKNLVEHLEEWKAQQAEVNDNG